MTNAAVEGPEFLILTRMPLKLRLCHKLKNNFPYWKVMGKWEEFSHDIQVDEDVGVGDYYKTHKLGLLRFC